MQPKWISRTFLFAIFWFNLAIVDFGFQNIRLVGCKLFFVVEKL
jgi:hypothetical protein